MRGHSGATVGCCARCAGDGSGRSSLPRHASAAPVRLSRWHKSIFCSVCSLCRPGRRTPSSHISHLAPTTLGWQRSTLSQKALIAVWRPKQRPGRAKTLSCPCLLPRPAWHWVHTGARFPCARRCFLITAVDRNLAMGGPSSRCCNCGWRSMGHVPTRARGPALVGGLGTGLGGSEASCSSQLAGPGQGGPPLPPIEQVPCSVVASQQHRTLSLPIAMPLPMQGPT